MPSRTLLESRLSIEADFNKQSSLVYTPIIHNDGVDDGSEPRENIHIIKPNIDAIDDTVRIGFFDVGTVPDAS